jgi:hypothetical protein
MPEIKKIAKGLAANLVQQSTDPSELQSLIEQAFCRGFKLGRTLRCFDALGNDLTHQPAEEDDPPWMTKH